MNKKVHTMKKIIVVDDCKSILTALKKMLEHSGYTVETVNSSIHALNRIKKAKPDLIFLDVNMPGIDGISLCRKIRKDEKIKKIPVIFLTGCSDDAIAEKCFEAGGSDYMTKPFEIENLLNRAERLLNPFFR